MDPVCHTLAGAALGKAGLARPATLGMATLVIAANLPDIDVAVFATPTLAVSFRRGWTHGVLAQLLLPLLLGGAMLAWDRTVRQRRANAPPPARMGELLVAAYAGVLSHVFLDFLNSYGIRLLMPFSNRWFYGDALYIVDPWMYLLLGGSVWLAARREHLAPGAAVRLARIGLALTAGYVGLMLASTAAARAVVIDGLTRAGQPADTKFMVTPVLVNPFTREVVFEVGDAYEKGLVWFAPAPHFRPAGFGMETGLRDPAVQAALASPRARAFLAWSRFPFVVADPATAPPRVWLNDYRYANVGPGGWSAADVTVTETVPRGRPKRGIEGDRR